MTGTECTHRTTRTPRPREGVAVRLPSLWMPLGEGVERTAKTGRDGSAITPNIYLDWVRMQQFFPVSPHIPTGFLTQLVIQSTL